jgi:hypothetical protein
MGVFQTPIPRPSRDSGGISGNIFRLKMEKTETADDVYEALVITAGAIGISLLSKKALKQPLGTPESMNGYMKLAISVSVSTLLFRYLQNKKYLPVDPFKKA